MFKIAGGSKFIMAGDSITDAGRTYPQGEGLFNPYGNGYVHFVNAMVNAVQLDNPVRFVNMGIAGDTSRDLLNRWEKDILDKSPDWVSVMIGANDVWRKFDSELYPENQVDKDEYRDNLNKMITMTGNEVKGFILISPFFCDLNKKDKMRAELDQYIDIMKQTAVKHDCFMIDVQASIDSYLNHHHSSAISWDRVHPNDVGHMIVARTVVKKLGLEF